MPVFCLAKITLLLHPEGKSAKATVQRRKLQFVIANFLPLSGTNLNMHHPPPVACPIPVTEGNNSEKSKPKCKADDDSASSAQTLDSFSAEVRKLLHSYCYFYLHSPAKLSKYDDISDRWDTKSLDSDAKVCDPIPSRMEKLTFLSHPGIEMLAS
jgi:hypothetical protein